MEPWSAEAIILSALLLLYFISFIRSFVFLLLSFTQFIWISCAWIRCEWCEYSRQTLIQFTSTLFIMQRVVWNVMSSLCLEAIYQTVNDELALLANTHIQHTAYTQNRKWKEIDGKECVLLVAVRTFRVNEFCAIQDWDHLSAIFHVFFFLLLFFGCVSDAEGTQTTCHLSYACRTHFENRWKYKHTMVDKFGHSQLAKWQWIVIKIIRWNGLNVLDDASLLFSVI